MSEYQRVIASIRPMWAELLNVDDGAVTENTDFFRSGGHSLSAMLLVTRVERTLGKSVPLFALVQNSTVASFAKYLVETNGTAPALEPPAPDGSPTQTERLLGYNEPERRSIRGEWFEQYYATAMKSAAHAEFCLQVYGRNLGQHGMADLSQIDRLLAALSPAKDDVILDLGCGYGLISDYLSERTGARVVGVDLSRNAIAYADELAKSNDRLRFEVMDIRDLQFPPGTFSHIVSIDTIYYVPSLRSLLAKLKTIGNDTMRLGIIRTFPIRSFTRETWSPALTELATLLTETFGWYEAADLSSEENEHWKKKVEVLEQLRDQFIREGNEDLFQLRYREATYEAGIEQFRYMFVSGHR